MPAVSSEFTSPDSDYGATNSQSSKMTDKDLTHVISFVYDRLSTERDRLEFEALLEPDEEKAKIFENILDKTRGDKEGLTAIMLLSCLIIGITYLVIEYPRNSQINLTELSKSLALLYVLSQAATGSVKKFDDSNVRKHSIAAHRYTSQQESK